MVRRDPVFAAVHVRGLRRTGGVPMATTDGSGRRRPAPGRLAKALGHRFARPELLAEALTHRSAAGGSQRFDYERLEFLGDRVLGLVVADLLLEAFPDEPEGSLARRFTGLVRREALEKVAAALDLGRYLRLAESEERAGGRDNRGIQADACEAVIGAVYLDGGFEAAREIVLRHWRPLLNESGPAPDSKTRLQEWAQARGLPLPRYRVIEEAGPAHDPSFTMEVSVRGERPIQATASSKRQAEQEAAAMLLRALGATRDATKARKGGRGR